MQLQEANLIKFSVIFYWFFQIGATGTLKPKMDRDNFPLCCHHINVADVIILLVINCGIEVC